MDAGISLETRESLVLSRSGAVQILACVLSRAKKRESIQREVAKRTLINVSQGSLVSV